MAINGHGRYNVFKEFFENGGTVATKPIEKGDPRFQMVNVHLLSKETTQEERDFIALSEYETEENGSKPLGFYGQMMFLCVKMESKTGAYIAVIMPHL